MGPWTTLWLASLDAAAEPPPIEAWQVIDEDSRMQLTEGLRSTYAEDRAAALRALGPSVRDTAILEVVLRTDPSTSVRRLAFMLVISRWDAGIQPEWHRDMVRWQLERGFPPDRVAAAEALAQRVDDPEMLAVALDDPLADVRRLVVEGLALRGDSASIALLRAHAEVEPRPDVRALARRALDVADGIVAIPALPPAPVLPLPAPAPVPPAPVPEVALAPPEPEAPSPEVPVLPPEPTSPLADPEPVAVVAEPDALPSDPESAWSPIVTRTPGISTEETGVPVLGAAYGAYLGGLTAWLVGEAAEAWEDDHQLEGVAQGVVVGALAGTGTAALVAALEEVPETTPLTVGSTTLLGGVIGGHLGAALIPPGADGADERMQAAGLGGTLGGLGVGLLLPFEPAPLATVHVDLASGLGWLVASGVSDVALLDPSDRQLRGAIGLGGTLAFGAFAVATTRMDLPVPEPQTFLLTGAQGAWIGAMAPYLFEDAPDVRQSTGGLRVGLGVGYVAGVGWMAVGQPSLASSALQGVGMVAGNALGAGLPLAVGGEGATAAVVAPMLAGGVLGQLGGGLLAPHFELSDRDLVLLGCLGGWTTWQTAGWASYASMVTDDRTRVAGHALAAGGAGALVTTPLLAAVDLPAPASVELVLAGGWGTWFGAWGSQLADLDPDTQMVITLGSGDLALVGTAVAEGIGVRPDWRDLAVSNGGGLLGAAAGGLAGVLFLYQEDDWDPLLTSTLIGSGVGLVAGTTAAALTHGGTRAEVSRVGTPLEVGRLPEVVVLPWTDAAGGQGVWLNVSDRL